MCACVVWQFFLRSIKNFWYMISWNLPCNECVWSQPPFLFPKTSCLHQQKKVEILTKYLQNALALQLLSYRVTHFKHNIPINHQPHRPTKTLDVFDNNFWQFELAFLFWHWCIFMFRKWLYLLFLLFPAQKIWNSKKLLSKLA